MITINRLYQHPTFIYVFAALASVALSIQVIHLEGIINPDAICYLSSAMEMTQSGIRAAMHFCPQAKWPFYSLLIAKAAQLTHLSHETSAFILNGLFSVVTMVGFITIIKELSSSRRVVWLAVLTILLSYHFNKGRLGITRDHGYWACYVWSLCFLLRYFRTLKSAYALAFSLSLCIAALFRIEGVVFLFALPFLSWFYLQQDLSTRLKLFLKLNALQGSVVFGLLVWFAFHSQMALDELGRLHEPLHQLLHGWSAVWTHYVNTKQALRQYILPVYAMSDADILLCLALPLCYLFKIMSNLTWVYSLLVLRAWKMRAAFLSPSARLVLIGYVSINLLITFGFYAENLYLERRYLVPFSLVLMIWVPFALDKCRGKTFVAALILIGATALGGIFNLGPSNYYVREAGNWLEQQVPQEARLYVNDAQVMYYSQHFGNRVFKEQVANEGIDIKSNDRWKNYDYLVLRFGHNDKTQLQAFLQATPLKLVQSFKNNRGDQVMIFKNGSPSSIALHTS